VHPLGGLRLLPLAPLLCSLEDLLLLSCLLSVPLRVAGCPPSIIRLQGKQGKKPGGAGRSSDALYLYLYLCL
jgi:hypothetical protein